ncbi:MAG: hypothetical protein AAGA56_02950 [Myxococcota bacterium]
MFGLGAGELLLLIAVIALVGGPSAVRKAARGFQQFQKVKSKMTPQGLLEEIVADDPPKKKRSPKKEPSGSD